MLFRSVSACHQQLFHVPRVVPLQDYYPVLHGPAARALLLEFPAGLLQLPLIDSLDDGHQLLELLLRRVYADALRLLLFEDVAGAYLPYQSAFLGLMKMNKRMKNIIRKLHKAEKSASLTDLHKEDRNPIRKTTTPTWVSKNRKSIIDLDRKSVV